MSLLITGTSLLHASPSPADASLVPALESFFVESTRFAERLSPDGMKVAYLGPDDHAINRLWMVNLNAPENPKIISSEVTTAVASFFWIGDGNLLWQSTDAEGRARLFFTETARGQTRDILPNEKRRISLEGVVDSEEPGILVGLSDESNAFPDLYRVSLRENEAPVLALTNHHQIITWAWDAHGKPVAGWEAKSAAPEAEQRRSCAMFGLPAGKLRFHRLPEDATGHMADSAENRTCIHTLLDARSPESVILPHGNDSNADHRRTFRWFQAWRETRSNPPLALLVRDPKNLGMRVDLITPYDTDTASWKAALLRCHRSQHERNLRTRDIGFDERILAPERAAAAPYGFHAVESFECLEMSTALGLR